MVAKCTVGILKIARIPASHLTSVYVVGGETRCRDAPNVEFPSTELICSPLCPRHTNRDSSSDRGKRRMYELQTRSAMNQKNPVLEILENLTAAVSGRLSKPTAVRLDTAARW